MNLPMKTSDFKWFAERSNHVGINKSRSVRNKPRLPWDTCYRFTFNHLVDLKIWHYDSDDAWHALFMYDLRKDPIAVHRPGSEYKAFIKECRKLLLKSKGVEPCDWY